jgi:hypothetical protein
VFTDINGVGRPAAGSYSFRLLDPAQQRELPLNQTIAGTLTPGVSTAIFRVSGPAGQKLRFVSTFGTGNAGKGTWSLFGPDIPPVLGPNNPPLAKSDLGSELDLTLPATGEYVLVLSGSNAAQPVGYQFQVGLQ